MVVTPGDVFSIIDLIKSIVRASKSAQKLKKDCHNFAEYLGQISIHLEKLQGKTLSDSTLQTLVKLEDILRRSYDLVLSLTSLNFLEKMATINSIRDDLKGTRENIKEYLLVILLAHSTDAAYPFPADLYSLGPCGGGGGRARHMNVIKASNQILRIQVRHGWAIDAIRVLYRYNGEDVWTESWGGSGGQLSEINLNVDGEYLTCIKGRYGMYRGHLVIRSLTFVSNIASYGPYGKEDGVEFNMDARGGRIVGFTARSGLLLDAIGICVAGLPTAPVRQV